jgi:hypothetical protein
MMELLLVDGRYDDAEALVIPSGLYLQKCYNSLQGIFKGNVIISVVAIITCWDKISDVQHIVVIDAKGRGCR